jgi:hypothetical protein
LTQVFTTKLVLASRGYGWLREKEVCRALRRVVVETWEEGFPGRGLAEAVEYIDMRESLRKLMADGGRRREAPQRM